MGVPLRPSLIGLSLLLVGCSAKPSSGPVPVTTGPAPARAQITVPTALADQSCNAGGGSLLGVSTPQATLQSTILRALALPDGDVLVGTESGNPPPGAQHAQLIIRAITPTCRLDPRFGTDGTEAVDLPATSDYGYSTMNDWAPDGDGIVMVGATATNGYVMKLTATGRVDRQFGANGVATVVSPDPSKFGSELDRVTVTSAGQIIVGADDGGAHCCLTTYVARLDPDGRLDPSFGFGGWSQILATGARMQQVVVRSDGSTLVELSRIDTGGGTEYVYELNSRGSLVGSFTDNFAAALSSLDSNVFSPMLTQGGYFDDDMVPLAGGDFELVGTGAANGAGMEPMYLMAARFSPDGSLDRSYGHHGSMVMAQVDGGEIAALLMPDGDTVFVDEPWVAPHLPLYGSNGTLRLTFLTPRGSLDTRRVADGIAVVDAANLSAGSTPAYSSGQWAAAATGKDILVVTPTTVGINVLGFRG